MRLALLGILVTAATALAAPPVTKGFIVSSEAGGGSVTFVTKDAKVTVKQERFRYNDTTVSGEELVSLVTAETHPVKVWVRGGVAEVYVYRTLPHAPAR